MTSMYLNFDFYRKSEKQQKQLDDERTFKNRQEFIAGFATGITYWSLVVSFFAMVEEANAAEENPYCDSNYIDLDLSEEERIAAHKACLADRAAAESANLGNLGRIGAFLVATRDFLLKNSNAILGFGCAILLASAFYAAYPQFAKKLNRNFRNLDKDKEK